MQQQKLRQMWNPAVVIVENSAVATYKSVQLGPFIATTVLVLSSSYMLMYRKYTIQTHRLSKACLNPKSEFL